MSNIIWNYNLEKEYKNKLKRLKVFEYIVELEKELWKPKLSDEKGEKICMFLKRLYEVQSRRGEVEKKKKESYKQKYMFNGFAKK